MADKKIHDPLVTKHVIKNAFIQLLTEKSYDQITVAELTRAANINRVTFYSHYDNVYNLMVQIETEYATRVLSSIDGLFKTKDYHDTTSNLFIDTVLDIPEISVWFMHNKTTGTGENMIYEKTKAICISEWKKHKKMSTGEFERFFDFLYWGSISFLKNWLNNNYGTDYDELRKEFSAITGHVTSYIMG